MDSPRRPFHDSRFEREVAGIRASARRWRFASGFALFLICGLIWGAWYEIAAYERRQYLEATARRQTNLAITAEHYIERVLRTGDAIASVLATAHREATSDASLIAAMDQRARNNDILSGISICFETGAWLSTMPVTPATHEEWCKDWRRDRAGNGSRTHITQAVSLGDDIVVPITHALPGALGRPAGLAVTLVSVRRLMGLLEDYSLSEETTVLAIGSDGVPRARWNSRSRTSDQRAPEVAMLDALLGQPPATRAIDSDGVPHIATVRAAGAYPLVMLVATAEADVLHDPRRRAANYAWAAAAACLLLAGISLILFRMHNRSVRLAESLGRASDRLASLNIQLEQEVEARTRELADAYRDLESFTYTVAHDVRAPIAAIRGFAGVVLPAVERSGDDRMAHYMRRIAANAEQMHDLTETLLALGKLSRAPVTLVEVDLSAMALDVLAGLRERDEDGRNVEARVQPAIRVMADRVLLRLLLDNLLGNAWKFTSKRDVAEIDVHAESASEPGRIEVAIADNGAGFDTSKAGDIFQPFHRMHTAAEFPGTGVGLASVQRIVRRHGGAIRIESQEDVGTTVRFTLASAPGPKAQAG